MRGKFSVVIFVIVGLYIALVHAPRYRLENISPEFLKLYGGIAVIPPQHWYIGAMAIGIVFVVIGLAYLLLRSRRLATTESTYVHSDFAATTAQEDALQSAVATGEQWKLARQTDRGEDSRPLLEALGVTIIGETPDDLFYTAEVPKGWHRDCESYHNSIYDGGGRKVLHQFCKLAPWDSRAWVRAS